MEKTNKSKIIYYLFIIISYVLIFQNLLQQYIDFLGNFDEILALVLIPVVIIILLKNKNVKITKINLGISISLILLFLVGIYASIKYKYQPYYIALSDALLVFKFFLVYFLMEIVNKNNYLEKYSNRIIRHFKVITVILFAFTVINYIFHIYPSELRYGIMSNKLFYTHPTYLVAVCVFILAGLLVFRKKLNTIYIYMLILMILSTMRMKAIAFLAVFILLAFYVMNKNKKITFTKLGIACLICICIAFQQIEYYFITLDDSARAVLLKTSFEIANDYVPIGTGFGTYASHFSAESYSPVYSLYNIENTYGLEEGKTEFIADSFWPMILGQFGYLGLVLYVICIYLIFRKIQLQYSVENKYQYLAKLGVLVYLLISSTSETAFVNPIAIPLALILAI